jgi:hypothetical protein
VTEPPFVTPREPEIEWLGRAARRALVGLRVLFWCLGAAAIAGAVWVTVDPALQQSEQGEPAPLATRVAHNLTFAAFAVPLLLPVGWTFGRGWKVALALGALLWLGPMLLPGDHPWGCLIRAFATLVGCAILLVWRTLWSLTAPAPVTR